MCFPPFSLIFTTGRSEMAVDVVFEVDDEGKLLCAVDFQHYDGPRMLDVTIYVKELSDDRINHARNQRLDNFFGLPHHNTNHERSEAQPNVSLYHSWIGSSTNNLRGVYQNKMWVARHAKYTPNIDCGFRIIRIKFLLSCCVHYSLIVRV